MRVARSTGSWDGTTAVTSGCAPAAGANAEKPPAATTNATRQQHDTRMAREGSSVADGLPRVDGYRWPTGTSGSRGFRTRARARLLRASSIRPDSVSIRAAVTHNRQSDESRSIASSIQARAAA